MNFVDGKGFEFKATTFAHHVAVCEQCKAVNEYDAPSLAKLCLEGVILYKQDHAQPVKRQRRKVSKYHCSKDELKRAMKYKE